MSTTAPVQPVRVLIVDDHPMVAEGLRALLETYDDLAVVGTLTEGRQAVERAGAPAPDVVLLDLDMPGLDGPSATEILRERHPGIAIPILTMRDAHGYGATALRHGAAGYRLEGQPTDEIRHAIDIAHGGGRYLCPGAESAPVPAIAGAEPPTAREQTIPLKLAPGRSNEQVAHELDISGTPSRRTAGTSSASSASPRPRG